MTLRGYAQPFAPDGIGGEQAAERNEEPDGKDGEEDERGLRLWCFRQPFPNS